MLEGILILWFVLTGLSVLYITYDLIFVTPEAPVMKLGWWLVTLYTGPIGLFFYLLSCKEPMPMTHEKFVEPLWKQSLGSMVHCLAGDVTGIILAAIILAFFAEPPAVEITIEYVGGFLFGLLIFQSLFMKGMMGGTYMHAVKTSFYPEFISMNMIMAAMIPIMVIWNVLEPAALDPRTVYFWGKMSLATIVAGIAAYPVNKWLVQKGLKHGMMTVRKESAMAHKGHKMEKMEHKKPRVSRREFWGRLLFSIGALIVGIAIAIIFAALYRS